MQSDSKPFRCCLPISTCCKTSFSTPCSPCSVVNSAGFPARWPVRPRFCRFRHIFHFIALSYMDASLSTTPMKTAHSKNRSLKQNSNRLAAYLATGIGAGLVATPSADAAIVNIDLTSTGFNLTGVNAGLSPGSSTAKNNFPISGGGTLYAYNDSRFMGIMGGYPYLSFAVGSSPATPVKFTLNQPIGASASWSSSSKRSLFKGGLKNSNTFYIM